QKEANDKNFEVLMGEGNGLNFEEAKKKGASVLVDGYYVKKEGNNLEIYIQIYDVDSKAVIDAYHESYNFPELEGVKLDPNEIKKPDDQILEDASKKVLLKIRSNPNKKQKIASIEESLVQQPIYSKDNFAINIDEKKAAEDVFNLLKSTEIVTASRSKESMLDVPATTMVITEEDFKNRGYTSLDDIFRDLPGFDYIGQQGTDHSVLYQRGYRTPFTSRILLMIDSVVENDLWAQVATPSRMYPISNIKRVEIIYGPASAVYGPNAFQGIINIITKTGKENDGKAIAGKTSFMYGNGPIKVIDGGVTSSLGDFSIAMSARKIEGNDYHKNMAKWIFYWI
ncbi:MAG: TonB-dependent receptor, partial [Leptospiraceae bacterium]|nr:TonB-dependent receptor [Leptospiraceae bacterium]